MSANVCCADDYGCRRLTDATGVVCGLPKEAHIDGHFELVCGHRYKPCGWQGERFPSVPITRMAAIARADFERKATAKRCPRCGGHVELIFPAP
jgi:hypothetical protein